MMACRRLLCRTGAAVMVWGLPHVALCEPGSTPEAVLPEVNVTADRDREVQSEPQSSISLDRAQILRRGAQNVGEALKGEAGVAVASDSAQGQNPVVRGLQKESIVLLVDGMRLNAEQPYGALASFISLDLADRLDVVKGPASVLYGSGALGGAINVTLKQARFKPGLASEFGAGYDSASRGMRGSGVANLSGGDHALMAGFSSARVNDYTTPAGKAPRTGYDSDAFIAQYRFRIDPSQQLRLSLQRQADHDVWYPGTTDLHPFAQSLPLPFFPWVQDRSEFTMVFRSPQQSRQLMELGYNGSFNGERALNLDVRVYRQEMERSINAWADWLSYDIVKTQVTFATEGVEAKADWAWHPQHLLTAGVSGWRMTASPQRYLLPMPDFLPSNETRNDPFTGAYVESLGLYALNDMRFGDLNVVAGLRSDTVKGGAASMTNGLNAVVSEGLDREDQALSGSLGASYEVARGVRPYVNVSRAFRAPSLIERFVTGPRGDGYWYSGDPQAKPELATQLEIGVRGESDALEYSLAVYRNRISDYLTGRLLPFQLYYDPANSGNVVCGGPFGKMCKKTVNLGKAVIQGLEASMRWRLVAGHELSARLSMLRGDNTDFDEPLYRMPADELSIGWDGPWTVGALKGNFDAQWRLVRRQNRVATVFSSGQEDPSAGFGVLDLGATWPYAKRQSLRMAMKNVFDKLYHEHLAVGVPGRELDAPGRSVQVVWSGKF